jgi:hypothetical protein
MSPAAELAVPNKAVEVASSKSLAQKDLKKSGKNPAKTVVAKTEFAQSYRDQENFSLKVYLFVTVILRGVNFMYHIMMKDSEITKNLIVFFILIAGLTFILGLIGYFIQESDFRQEIEEESRASYLESS